MKITAQPLDDVLLIEGSTFSDARGWFRETWRDDHFGDAGIPAAWQQDNQSLSVYKGTIRGLHWQKPPFAQAKLVRVITGRILDIVVDIRKSSPNFGKGIGVELSGQANQAVYVPTGFAHGFCTLEANTIVTYKTSMCYNPQNERAMNWASAGVGIDWPFSCVDVIISDKDAAAPDLKDIAIEDLF